MFAIQSKYQAVIFLNGNSIAPTPEIIKLAIEMFSDQGLLPNIVQQLDAQIGAMLPRLRLSSSNNEWHITFGGTRIDIEKNPIATNGSNMGELEDFINMSKDFFTRILTHFKLKANRLSIVSSGMFEEMNEDKLSEIQNKFCINLPFFQETPPYEWKVHNVASRSDLKIEGQIEPMNVITSVARTLGQIIEPTGFTQFDRIEVNFDINTKTDNTDNRFSVDSLDAFFSHCLKIRLEILKQIEEKIHG